MISTTYTTLLLLACATFAIAVPLIEPAASLQARAADGRPPGFTFLGYDPSTPLTIVGTVAFGGLAARLTLRHLKLKARYMLPMIVGAWFYTAGIALRFGVVQKPDSLSIFIAHHLFVILSPCAFIASVYAILGQMALRLNADDCLPISATKIAKYFIWSDVVTFLIQSGGGGMQVQQSLSITGSKIVLVGLVLQLISFGIFCILSGMFFMRLRARYPNTFGDHGWHPLAYALMVACLAVIVRSSYRTVENAQGFHGYLAVREGYFWALDALPMAVTIGLFVPCWPELFLPNVLHGLTAISLNSINSK